MWQKIYKLLQFGTSLTSSVHMYTTENYVDCTRLKQQQTYGNKQQLIQSSIAETRLSKPPCATNMITILWSFNPFTQYSLLYVKLTLLHSSGLWLNIQTIAQVTRAPWELEFNFDFNCLNIKNTSDNSGPSINANVSCKALVSVELHVTLNHTVPLQ